MERDLPVAASHFGPGLAAGLLAGVTITLAAFVVSAREMGQDAATAPQTEVATQPASPPPATIHETVTLSVVSVNLGPGDGYATIGALPEGAVVLPVEVTGEWTSIRFPPGSSGTGWVPSAELGIREMKSEVLTAVSEPVQETAAETATARPPVLDASPRVKGIIAGLSSALAAVTILLIARSRRSQPVEVIAIAPEGGQPVLIVAPSVPEEEEPVMNMYQPQENTPPENVESMIAQSTQEFSQSLRDSMAGMSAAIEKLGGNFALALTRFSEEQRALMERHESLLQETRGAAERAREAAESAAGAAGRADGLHQQATDVLSRLEEDRRGVSSLVADLRGRISALSVLVAPLPDNGEQQQTAPPETGPEGLA